MHVEGLISFNWTIVMVLVTFLVLYFILKKYFFEYVRKFMLAREQKVIDSFDNAAEANRAAEERLNEYNSKLENIERERREVLTAAKLKADESAQLTVQDAEKKAAKLLLAAREEISREKERALQEMREQISLLAIYAAEKIIEQKLDAPAQQAIVDGVIEQAGQTGWKI